MMEPFYKNSSQRRYITDIRLGYKYTSERVLIIVKSCKFVLAKNLLIKHVF